MNENNTPMPTLSDLANGAIPTATPVGMPTQKLNTESAKPADIREAVTEPPKAVQTVEGTGNPMLDKAFLGLDDAITRLGAESSELLNQAEEKKIQEALDNEGDNLDALDENTSNTYYVSTFDPVEETPTVEEKVETVRTSAPVVGTTTKEVSVLIDKEPEDEEETTSNTDEDKDEDSIELDDLDNLFDEDSDKEGDEGDELSPELKESIRHEMSENFNPVMNKIDLGKFTISKKPIAATKVIKDINEKPIECADGVIFEEGKTVRMSAFSPLEIQSLDPREGTRSNYFEYMKNKLNLVYDHIIDENKPKSMEAWAKITPNISFDDYMFTAYKATFGRANIITYNCLDDDCSNVFLETIDVNKMLKFDTEETKKRYYEILHSGAKAGDVDGYKIGLYQASDDYVFGLKMPSLYNTFIEPTLVDSKTRKKYENLMIILTYVDCVYKINRETNELVLVDTSPTKDKKLTYQRRLKVFATIIKSLTSDQLQALQVESDKYDSAKLDDNGNVVKKITYMYPKQSCPKCGKEIPEQEMAPDSMLFMRHQLGLMKKI